MSFGETSVQLKEWVLSRLRHGIWRKTGRRVPEVAHYYLMLLPGLFLLFAFNYVPLFGSVMAFQKFIPARGILRSQWVGLDNFTYMFEIPDARQVFTNTIFIASAKLIALFLASLAFALLLNELRIHFLKSAIQTVAYLPHFLSWVILAVLLRDIFSLDGAVNQFLGWFGVKPIYFLGSNRWFPALLIGSDTWKEFGFNAIIFLTALTAISPELYEAAAIDGAGRWQRIIHITFPGIMPTAILVACLWLGNILNAGFDQIFNLYNPLVYPTSDIIDTYVYRMGLLQAQYSLGTAVGLLKSLVSFIMIILSYWLARKFANYRIF
jgi:putative aldouronate transport system permease protein